jgi:DNA repair exonuclease SbcCD nuclease subunit
MLVAHLSDLHLGAKSVGDPYGAERLNSLRQALQTLAACKPDVIVIAGDMFDHPLIDRAVIEEAAKLVDNVGNERETVPVVLVPGNHDPADANILWATFRKCLIPSSAVRVALMPEAIELAAGKLIVHAYPCQTRYSPEPPWEKRLSGAANADTAFHVVVAHGTLQGGPVPEGETDAYPFAHADVEALNADYVALGHFHGLYPAWPDGDECERTYSYCGTHEPDQFAGDAGYAILATLTKGRCPRLRRIKVGRRQWRLIPVNGPVDLAALEKLRREIVAGNDPSRFVIRLKIGGPTWSAADIEQLHRLEASLRNLGCTLDSKGEARAQLDVGAQDWKGLPSGAVKEALLALQAEWTQTTDEKKREMLSAALQLGWKKIQEAVQS